MRSSLPLRLIAPRCSGSVLCSLACCCSSGSLLNSDTQQNQLLTGSGFPSSIQVNSTIIYYFPIYINFINIKLIISSMGFFEFGFWTISTNGLVLN